MNPVILTSSLMVKAWDKQLLVFPSLSSANVVLVATLPWREPTATVTREAPHLTAPPMDSSHTSG